MRLPLPLFASVDGRRWRRRCHVDVRWLRRRRRCAVVGDRTVGAAVVVAVARIVARLRVQLTEFVAFVALATDAVVATHHVVDRGVFFVTGGFVVAAATVMLAQSVRPAVLPALRVHGRRGER